MQIVIKDNGVLMIFAVIPSAQVMRTVLILIYLTVKMEFVFSA